MRRRLVSLATAEAVKYASNSWRAVKVTFANEIGNIAKACGIDGQQVMKLICSDTKVNISPYFMRPGFAFGGSCLPKDLRALKHLAAGKQVATPLLSAVLSANQEQIARAEKMIEAKSPRSVGMVRINFKPGTDDLREPLGGARFAPHRKGRSAGLRPVRAGVCQRIGRRAGEIPDLAQRMVPGISELIDGSDMILVGNRYAETIEELSRASESRPLVDLTRINPMLRSNALYEGICW